jgi:protein-disulfide isomerase
MVNRSRLSDLITGTAVLVAIVMIVITLRQRHDAAAAPPPAPPRRVIASWADFASHGGHSMGSPSAVFRVVEYSDFTCKYCGEQYSGLRRLRDEFPDHVQVVYKHYVRSTIGLNFALGAECAGERGKFEAYHNAAFEMIASGDSVSIQDVAKKAGVKDSAAFIKCVDTQQYKASIDSSMAEARSFGTHATPTLLVNGVFFGGRIAYGDLRSFFIQVRDQRNPLPRGAAR